MRKAQASAAGSLIGIILLIFIFYIVFLPQEERQRILAEPPESVLDERQQTAYQPATLFREGIGRLEFTPTTGNKILLPNAFLEETKEARLLATTGAFNIKKFITRKTKTIEFSASTKTAILTFQVLKAKAILKIELNGKTILEDRVTTPQPIQLTDLKEYNKLTFSVTGGIFESKNYEIIDVKIIEQIPIKEKQTLKHTFSITENEYTSLKQAVYTFFPACVQTDVGTLTITLNGRQLTQTTPGCDNLNVHEIDKTELKHGKNTLEVYLDKGRVQMENGILELSYTPAEGYLKYFSLPAALEEDARTARIRVIMKITFIDDGQIKKATTNINGVLDAIDQKNPVFERDISRIIRAGNNYLRITPRNTLEILELEVRVA